MDYGWNNMECVGCVNMFIMRNNAACSETGHTTVDLLTVDLAVQCSAFY